MWGNPVYIKGFMGKCLKYFIFVFKVGGGKKEREGGGSREKEKVFPRRKFLTLDKILKRRMGNKTFLCNFCTKKRDRVYFQVFSPTFEEG